MHSIAPEMVLGKSAIDTDGGRLGEIVDVGLFDHSRVKFLVIEDKARRIPIRCVGVGDIDRVEDETVHVRAAG